MRFVTATLIVLCLAVVPAAADVQLKFNDSHSGDTTLISVKDGMVRMETGDGLSLYNVAGDTIAVADRNDKTYFRMNRAELKSRMSQMQGMMSQMQAQLRERLKDLPADQRRMVEQQMGGLLAAQAPQRQASKPDLRATGSEQEVAGYRCRQYTLGQSGQKIKEFCVASRKTLGMSEKDFSALSSLFSFLGDMAASARSLDGDDTDMTELGALADMGVPVQTHNLQSGKNSRLLSVSTSALSAELFRMPDGYQARDPFGSMPAR